MVLFYITPFLLFGVGIQFLVDMLQGLLLFVEPL